MTTPAERRVNEHTSIGNMADGDKFLGERIDGTTVLITATGVTKLAGIETGATADQTAAEIKTAYESNADTNAFTDVEQTKLAAISGTNTGDQTSIVGITGTKAEFNTAVSDGNVIYVGDTVSNLAALTASRALVTDGSGVITPATTTAAEIGHVNGVTSAIQTQLDAKQTLDSELTALAGLVSAADKIPYFTGSGTAALADFSSALRTFLTTSSSANLRTLVTDESGTGALLFAGGNIGAATATSVNFGQDALNYYDEGTWVPVDSSGAGLTFANVTAKYTRMGRVVICTCDLDYPVTADSSVALIGGFPFPMSGNAGSGAGILSRTTVTTAKACHFANADPKARINTTTGTNILNSAMSGSLDNKMIFIYQA